MTVWQYIWIGLVAAAFVYAWRTGQLARLSAYVVETREELKKCAWPTWAELKGSTVVVLIAILLLGAFTVASDALFVLLVNVINS